MIIVRIWEGLGNQLFQYAYAKSVELRRGEMVYLDWNHCNNRILDERLTMRECQLKNFRITLKNYDNVEKYYFFLDGSNVVHKSIKYLAEQGVYPYKYYEEKDVSYKPELLNLKGNYYVQGWFQNALYFSDYEDVIRKEILPKKKIKLDKELRGILEKQNTVAVHIRRGDYKKLNNTLELGYYEQAVKEFNNRIEKPYFCIFSDELEWVKRNIKLDGKCFYVNEDRRLTDYEELMVMSRCRHNIIANSTYSWWGAWLNNNKDKIVVGPKNWFLDHRVINCGINIMPEDWIRL